MQLQELGNCIVSFFVGVFLLIWYFSYKSVPNIWLHDLNFFVILVGIGIFANLLSTSKKWPCFCIAFPLASSMTIISIDDIYNSYSVFAALIFSISPFLAHFLTIKLIGLYLSIKANLR